jgi:hypothetical protein
MEFSDEVTMAVVSLPSPRDDGFLHRSRNPVREIDDAILSVNHKPITWSFAETPNGK